MGAVVVSPVAACPAAAFRRAVVRPTARAAPFLGGAPIRMLKHAAARGGSITIASKASNRGRHVVAVQSLAVIASGAARDDRDPRDSPIARIAAGIDSSAPGGSHRVRTEDAEDAVGSPPGGLATSSVGDTLDAWLRRAWAARKMVAGVALAVVLALCDAAPAVAKGRGGGGRSGGRMGGSSFRPSGTGVSRSMVSEDARVGPCGVTMAPVIVFPPSCVKRDVACAERRRGGVLFVFENMSTYADVFDRPSRCAAVHPPSPQGGSTGGMGAGAGTGTGRTAGTAQPGAQAAAGARPSFMPSFFFMPSFGWGGYGYGMGYGMGGGFMMYQVMKVLIQLFIFYMVYNYLFGNRGGRGQGQY